MGVKVTRCFYHKQRFTKHCHLTSLRCLREMKPWIQQDCKSRPLPASCVLLLLRASRVKIVYFLANPKAVCQKNFRIKCSNSSHHKCPQWVKSVLKWPTRIGLRSCVWSHVQDHPALGVMPITDPRQVWTWTDNAKTGYFCFKTSRLFRSSGPKSSCD